MKLFSERYGYTKPSDVIIREKLRLRYKMLFALAMIN